MRKSIVFLSFLFLISDAIGQNVAKRLIRPEDIYRMKSVGSPKISPDGNWILYSLSKIDSAKDRSESKLYMISTNGEETIQLTDERSAGSPAWSPDNKYISFTSKGKAENSPSQIFLMNRKGGEPMQLTEVKGEISRYKWFYDGSKILIEMRDPNTADTAKTKIRKPFEIDRYHFKDDIDGYLDNRKTHLYVFDIKTKKIDTLTRGNKNQTNASVSHDGKMIAYVSNITDDPDRNANTDVFLMDLASKQSQQITTFKGPNSSPDFSPDDQYISFNQSTGEGNFTMYELSQLHLYHIPTKKITNISAALDRSVQSPIWSNDSKFIYALVEDDRKQNITEFDVAKNAYRSLTNEVGSYASIDINSSGQMVALYGNKDTPNEIYTRKGSGFSRLTNISAEFLAPLKPVYVKGFEAMSSDKNQVNGILYLPDSTAKNLPLILFIHGGPVAQDEYAFDMSRQILAGAGFAVAAVNYRGSSGRGIAYTKAIYADWGNKEVKDIIGVADHLIKTGIADPSKLGIGGWSYGGILTNYTIATDTRFKAAVSGAGSSLQLALYGSDQYINQYEEELGKPWKNPKKWMDLSYPFYKVEQIKTPTVFMASEDDFNVPVIGAEQMYQAFKSTGIPTELVIYPGQHHGVRVPSYIIHRYKKHIDWYKKYLK
ncbi:MAG TPA: S9 family peptidase [Chitinophagaceae bacterium]|nr:S9 family peptidase [Chitinophagaceae bacterium]